MQKNTSKTTKIIAVLVSIVMLVSVLPLSVGAVPYVLATGVKLERENLILEKGASYMISAEVLPEDATFKDVNFGSSDESVAVVDENGVITALDTGTAYISAWPHDVVEVAVDENGNELYFGNTAILLTVVDEITENDISGIFPRNNEIKLCVGGTERIIFDVGEGNANMPVHSFSSAETSIAEVDENGIVTAVGVGKTNITVSALGRSVSVPVEVIDFTVPDAIIIKPGMSGNVGAVITPADADVQLTYKVRFNHLGPNVIRLSDSNGSFTANNVGSDIIEVSFGNVVKRTAIHSVDDSLEYEEKTINIGDEISPIGYSSVGATSANTLHCEMSYSSSDENVATVDGNGNVVGVGAGKATITATFTYSDGNVQTSFTQDEEFIVLDPNTPSLDEYDLIVADFNLMKGMTQSIAPGFNFELPAGCDTTFTYSSDDEDVACVDEAGIVTGVSEGTAKITVKAELTLNGETESLEKDVCVTVIVSGPDEPTTSEEPTSEEPDSQPGTSEEETTASVEEPAAEDNTENKLQSFVHRISEFFKTVKSFFSRIFDFFKR